MDEVFDACEDGDVPWLLEIMDDGIDDIDATDAEGFTPLILAAHFGHTGICDILLKAKANPNIAAHDGCTALLCAVQGGHVDCIKQMIRYKADVNPRTKDAVVPTPLYTASQEGHASIVKILVKAKAKVDLQVDGVTPLFITCQEGQKGHTSICKKLLRDARIKVDDTTKEGTTPLLIAIQIGNLDEVELLLKAGANIELADRAGHTPLLTAATYGDLEVIEVRIQNGVDLQKKDHEGRTAHVILKEEFGEDLLKIAAENRRATDLDALHKAHRPTKATRRRSNLHDRINNKA